MIKVEKGDIDKLMEQIKKDVVRIMEDKSRRVIKKAKDNLLENDNIVTGRLYSSDYILIFEHKGEIHFGFDCPYATAVEFGTEPHKVPFDAIHEWVVRKFGLVGDEAKRVAWAIVKKIEKEGTNEYPYLRPALYEEFGGD